MCQILFGKVMVLSVLVETFQCLIKTVGYYTCTCTCM